MCSSSSFVEAVESVVVEAVESVVVKAVESVVAKAVHCCRLLCVLALLKLLNLL